MFKYFLILFLLITFVPMVRRFLFTLLVGRSMIKEQKKANQQYEQNIKKEGEVKVNYKPSAKDFKGGEYIDYEEVK